MPPKPALSIIPHRKFTNLVLICYQRNFSFLVITTDGESPASFTLFLNARGPCHAPLYQTIGWFHVDRVTCGDRDYRDSHRPASPCGAEGPRSCRPHEVPEQDQATDARAA